MAVAARSRRSSNAVSAAEPTRVAAAVVVASLAAVVIASSLFGEEEDVPAPLLPLACVSAAAVTGGNRSNVFDIDESRSFNKSFKRFGPATLPSKLFVY